MNILMISDVYFPRVNGVSTSIQSFRRHLQRSGHGVTLIAPDYGTPTDEEEDILRIPARRVLLDPEDRLMKGRRVRSLPLLRPGAFDIVHIQTPFLAHYLGVKLARELEIPRIESYHTFFEEYLFHYIPLLPKGWLRGVARLFSRRQCNDLDGLVVPSRAMAGVLTRYGVTTPMRIIPTGIEADFCTQGDGDAFRTRHGIDPGRPLLVHVGRLAFEKNIDFLLRMLVRVREHHPRVLLVIAGEGPAQPHIRRLGEQLGLQDNLLLVGYLSRRGPLEDCYRAGDAFVFASRTETQGLVLLEAMGLGVPVVSTAVMGTREVLVEGRGALIAREDEAHFAARVCELLDDPQRRRELARAGVDYARGWSPGVLTGELVDFYRQLIEGRSPATVAPVGKTP